MRFFFLTLLFYLSACSSSPRVPVISCSMLEEERADLIWLLQDYKPSSLEYKRVTAQIEQMTHLIFRCYYPKQSDFSPEEDFYFPDEGGFTC